MDFNYDKYGNGLKKGELLNNARFEIIEKIGEGAFGFVYSAYDNQNKGAKCAIKMIHGYVFQNQDLKSSIKEIDFLIKYQNEFIIKYIGHFVHVYSPCIATSFYENGDLDRFIKGRKLKNEKIDTVEIFFWSKEILEGIDFLHSNGIIHRDLKPSNIFMNGVSLVIGDLGIAKSLEDLKRSRTYSCTLFYASPEVLNREDYNFKADIWSFGCILHELVELEKAFDGANEYEVYKAIFESPIPQLSEPNLNSILSRCLSRNPNERPNAKELIEMVKIGKDDDLNLETNFSNVNVNEEDLNSIDKQVVRLNKKCRLIQEGNLNDISEMKDNYDGIKRLRQKFKINESNAKIDYIELLEKLACYEKEQLLNYNEALLMQKEILLLKNKAYPKNDIKIAATLINIGLVCFSLGQFNSAIKYYQEALEIKLKSLPNNHLSIAEIFNNLGNAYCYLNDTTNSMKALRQAMEIYESLSEDCLGYADNLYYFGKLQYRLEDLTNAKSCLEKALEIKRKILPETHSSIALTLNYLGVVYYSLQDKTRAIEYYDKALEMFRKTLPANHSSIADTLHNLGWINSDFGDKHKAIEFYEMALEIDRKTLPENHSSIAQTLNNVGAAYFGLGDKIKAKDYFERALEIYRKTLPEDHSSIAETLVNVGSVCDDLGDKNAAKDFFQKALEIKRKTLPENHLSIGVALHNIGRVYYDLGDKNKAVQYFEKALEIKKETLPESHASVVETLNNLGLVYDELGEANKSTMCLQNSSGKKRKTESENNLSIKKLLRDL